MEERTASPGWELLHGADRLLTEVIAGRDLLRHWLRLCVAMAACAALYGAVLGSWHGSRLAAYDAVKLPLVLLLTAALTVGFAWTAAAALGLPLRFGQVAVLTFLALCVASLLLASLAPIGLFFNLSAPEPAPAARTAHNLLYLLHTAFVGACGLAGTVALWKAMRRLDAPPRTLRAVYAVWVAAFALVGGEVAWVLRPFVGSVYMPVRFLRPDALQGNVYEFIVTDILKHFISSL
jgi:hypothetical protein